MSVEPALTAEEWQRLLAGETVTRMPDELPGGLPVWISLVPDRPEVAGQARAIAAATLYGQPFGFTWEDVDRLRYFPSWLINEMAGGFRYNDEGGTPVEDWLASVADRIAALLPPREPSKVKEAR